MALCAFSNPVVFLGVIAVAVGFAVCEYLQSKEKERAMAYTVRRRKSNSSTDDRRNASMSPFTPSDSGSSAGSDRHIRKRQQTKLNDDKLESNVVKSKNTEVLENTKERNAVKSTNLPITKPSLPVKKIPEDSSNKVASEKFQHSSSSSNEDVKSESKDISNSAAFEKLGLSSSGSNEDVKNESEGSSISAASEKLEHSSSSSNKDKNQSESDSSSDVKSGAESRSSSSAFELLDTTTSDFKNESDESSNSSSSEVFVFHKKDRLTVARHMKEKCLKTEKKQKEACHGYSKKLGDQKTKQLNTYNSFSPTERKSIASKNCVPKNTLCKACEDDQVSTITDPCKHSYLCTDCAVKVFRLYQKCFVCKHEVIAFKNIYKY